MVLSYENQYSHIEYQRAWIEIDLGALSHNVTQIIQLLRSQSVATGSPSQLMAVVKADGYGHGAVTVAKTALAAGAKWCAVATSQEGIELRKAGINAPILILGAINNPAEIAAIVDYRLQPTLCTSQQAIIFSDTLAQLKTTIPVHLNIDTGMSRLGTSWKETVKFVQFVQQLPQLKLASIYSHFATADDPDRTFMDVQHQRYQEAIAHLKAQDIIPPLLHIANSAATLSDRALHYDLVRVGLSLYGLYPSPHLQGSIDLKPVLQVKARITQVKTIPPHTGVSYGHRYVSDRHTQIAIVAIGYADGVPRLLSNKMEVLLRGQRVPQIGSITMDQLMLDVSCFADLQPGEVVTLIGKGDRDTILVEEWSDRIGTISWEILCGFKRRLPRVYC
ncbi:MULTISPECIES: alanine racemase [Spirulina sp. CCY15215]|uniref:alanine racemase n=1 Tax=Spirulina sp. CCY15215 TaxID=2767591 RepID=UPI00194F723C|nr:alanine racemase [Spirulina major]